MKRRFISIFMLCFLLFTILTMALQEYGSFNPRTLNFYLCLLQGLVFALIMATVLRVKKPSE